MYICIIPESRIKCQRRKGHKVCMIKCSKKKCNNVRTLTSTLTLTLTSTLAPSP